MTMTTLAGEVEIYLAGTGTAIINWGDGSKSQKRKLNPFDWREKLGKYKKRYSDNSAHTITITGGNITVVNCGRNQLTALDVSQITALEDLDCRVNQLTTLDLSRNTALKYLGCVSNKLTSLDVSKNTALEVLVCIQNHITALDVSKNIALRELHCFRNFQLASLNVSNNPSLKLLGCFENKLTELDVSSNIALEWLSCFDNQLSAAALNALLESLHDNDVSDRKVFIFNNPGTEDCDTSIAEKKGWKMK